MSAPEHRPLFSGGGLIALVGCALALLLLLLPLARARLQQAAAEAPSSLSLRYLALHVAKHPEDRARRLEYVEKLTESGLLAEARAVLLPLTAAGHDDNDDNDAARLLLIELDRKAWAAIDPAQAQARASALDQLLRELRALDAQRLPPREVRRFAALYRELDQPLTAAELLTGLYDREPSEDNLAAADVAWLAADKPARAAELQARFAAAQAPAKPDAPQRPSTQLTLGLEHAQLAIARVRAAGEPALTAAMIERMRRLFPHDRGLIELAIAAAEETSAECAYQLAFTLLREAPHEIANQRLVARLAEATGRSLRALDAYVWLSRHGGSNAEHARAVELARANWDLGLLRELLDERGTGAAAARPAKRQPHRPRADRHVRRGEQYAVRRSRLQVATCQAGAPLQLRAAQLRQLRERVALDEALGDAAVARGELNAALSGELADSLELWQQKLELEQRTGDTVAALATATRIFERFPSRASSEQLANLQLAAGRTRQALHTLRAIHDRDEAWLRGIVSLAFEVGDAAAERGAYEQLVKRDAATLWEYQRLWELAPDRAYALHIALAAFERFEAPQMLSAALELCAADDAARLALLERAERVKLVSERPAYWQTRISLYQQRAAHAAEKQQYTLAKQQLDTAERLLVRAADSAPEHELYQKLWLGQHAQALSVGLLSDDPKLTARAYDDYHEQLSLREQVYVLRRLGRQDEALTLARAALASPALPERDRGTLEADARALSQGIERYVRASGDATQMEGLLALRSAAGLEYGGRAAAIRGDVSFTQYRPRATTDRVLQGEARDVAGSLRGRLGASALELGVRVRDESTLRPFGTFALQLAGKPEAGAQLHVHVDDLTTDTTRLRALGVRDAVVLDSALPLGEHIFMSARAAAETFYTQRERSYLGAGLTFDAGVGTSFRLPADVGVAGFRLVGRAAPRFARSPAELSGSAKNEIWLPQSSEWAGLGASLGKGKLDAPPLIGRQFCYVLDAAAGWLWPTSTAGFSAQAGVGVSLFGADLLTLAARGGNVVGGAAWSASLGYGFSIDR